ncbi:glycosyltransferase [Chloroflexota bacterium]
MSGQEIKRATIFSIANPEHAIASLRLIGPLEEAGTEIVWWMPGQEYIPDLLSGSDLVIIQRDFPRFIDQYRQVHLDAHRLHIPVIFEIDDLLWELPDEHPDRTSHFYTEALMPMMFAAWAADGITVPSLGIKHYLSCLNPNIFVLPNYLNPKIWSLRNPVLEVGNIISIGYMGGDSHLPDLEMIEEVILDILDYYQGRVRFICWGVKPPPTLNEHPHVEWKSLTPGDYAEFAAYFNQQKFDFYITPLKDSLFNRSKSSIKVLEYTALGIAGVSSDLEPYANVITPGVTGLLAETSEQWKQHLNTLIEQPDLRLQFARQAQESIRSDWLLSDHYDLWIQAYGKILDSYSPREEVPQKLRLMESIAGQESDQLQQLHTKSNIQQAELDNLKESRAWKAAWGLKSKFNQINPRATRQPDQEILDES